MYVCVCVCVVDVVNGFGLLPSSQLNVIVDDDVVVECKANKFVFAAPDLYAVDGTQDVQLTAADDVEIKQNT